MTLVYTPEEQAEIGEIAGRAATDSTARQVGNYAVQMVQLEANNAALSAQLRIAERRVAELSEKLAALTPAKQGAKGKPVPAKTPATKA